jgi:hypothetical protein
MIISTHLTAHHSMDYQYELAQFILTGVDLWHNALATVAIGVVVPPILENESDMTL